MMFFRTFKSILQLSSCDKNANFEKIIQRCAGNLFCLRKEEGKNFGKKKEVLFVKLAVQI